MDKKGMDGNFDMSLGRVGPWRQEGYCNPGDSFNTDKTNNLKKTQKLIRCYKFEIIIFSWSPYDIVIWGVKLFIL